MIKLLCDLHDGDSEHVSKYGVGQKKLDHFNKLLYMMYTFQTVFPQFLQPVADIDLGTLAQRLTFCQEQEQNSSSPVQLPGTLFHHTFMTYEYIPKTTQECTF